MQLLQSFRNFIAEKKLFNYRDKLLIAVSGGIDSVVLCELCFQSGFDFAIAHCNFKLRGDESDGDESFVKQLATHYGVECFTAHFNTDAFAKQHQLSVQEAARKLRYDWFADLMNVSGKPSFDYLLTAHHANDNIETILMNFFKGTGISGLAGIRAKDSNLGNHIIRPLLFAEKNQLLEFAQQQNLNWREDASNASNKYTRNFFRNEIIPSLQQYFPQVQQNLINNIHRFEEVNDLYNIALQQWSKKLLIKTGSDFRIPVLALEKSPAKNTLLFELLKPFDFTPQQIPDIINLCKALSGKFVTSSTHRIIRNRKWLIIVPIEHHDTTTIVIDSTDDALIFDHNTLAIKKDLEDFQIQNDPSIAIIDSREITFPLLLRKWKPGDYFYPLGMEKKKKLSRFFIDQKLSIAEKEKIWVIESANKIVWVVGIRIDNRFRVRPSTTKAIQLSISK